ncbi:MAG: phage terminase small subunit [Sphingobium sp.]
MSLAAKIKAKKLKHMAAEEQSAATAATAVALATALAAPTTIPDFSIVTGQATAPSESPAARRRQEKLARLAIDHGTAALIAPDRSENGPEATEYELLMASFGEDLRRLKDIQSTEGKIAAKGQMIEAYLPHVDATLAAAAEAGTAVQDELLVNIMIWCLDIGDFARGLDIAEHVLRFGLRLPERFLRTPGTMIAEEVAEAALTAIKVDRDFDIATLQRTEALTQASDMPDIVKAKLQKALGLHFLRVAAKADENPETTPAGAPRAARAAALTHLKRALELDRKVGVIKEIEKVTGWLNKHGHADREGDDAEDRDEEEQE